MRELTFEEVQKESFAVLLYMKKICKENNIPFYLGYGTALGAIRHKGFIPWDDDIDVLMYRKDYFKLRDIINKQGGRYQVADYYTDKDYCLIMPKVYDNNTYSVWPVAKCPFDYGAWVDVFFLDNAPDDPILRRRFFNKLNILQHCYNYSLYGYSIKKSLVKYLISKIVGLLSPRYYVKKLLKISGRYNDQPCQNVNVSMFDRTNKREKYLWPKEMIGNGTTAMFEGEEFLVPEKIDEHLKNRFGDYMKFPPVEQRVSHHDIKLYYKDQDVCRAR